MTTIAASGPAGSEIIVTTERRSVSIRSIVVGTITAISIGMMLTALGSAAGFSFVDPWDPDTSDVAMTLVIASGVWLALVQFSSLAIGGYVATRLRLWVDIDPGPGARGGHAFGDTVHGIAVWAMTTLIAALVAALAIAFVAGTAVQTAATVATQAPKKADTANKAAEVSSPMDDGMSLDDSAAYYLLRLTAGQKEIGSDPGRADVLLYVKRALTTGAMDATDREALTVRLSALTGLPPGEAQRRIGEIEKTMQDARARTEAEIKVAAAVAAKSAAYLAAATFVLMLVGMIGAIFGARIGGRDERAVI